jgi:hypothetical protein
MCAAYEERVTLYGTGTKLPSHKSGLPSACKESMLIARHQIWLHIDREAFDIMYSRTFFQGQRLYFQEYKRIAVVGDYKEFRHIRFLFPDATDIHFTFNYNGDQRRVFRRFFTGHLYFKNGQSSLHLGLNVTYGGDFLQTGKTVNATREQLQPRANSSRKWVIETGRQNGSPKWVDIEPHLAY